MRIKKSVVELIQSVRNRISDLVYLICLKKFLKKGAKSLSKDQHKEIAGLFNDKALI